MKLQMLKQALIAYVSNSLKAIWSAVAHPLTIVGKKNCDVADYRIYGNSVQNGEPTPDNPVEVQSVGEYDEETGKYKVPITVSGKNIFKPYRVSTKAIRADVPPALTNSYGTTINTTDLSDNSVKVTQVPKENYSADHYRNGYICIQTEGLTVGKKYRLSFDIDILENPLNASRFYIYPGGQYPYISDLFSSTKQRVSCVFTEGLSAQATAYPYIEIRCMGVSFTASNFMITEEGYDTEFEPYIEPQTTNIYLDEPLRKVGGHADYVDFGKSMVVRSVKKLLLSGSEDWKESGYNNQIKVDYIQFWTDYCRSITGSDVALSNKFECVGQKEWSDLNLEQEFLAVTTSRDFGIRLSTSKVTSLNEFTKWLSENNAVLLFSLAKPTEEPIELPKLPTFKGTTVYEAQTEIPPSGMQVQYY